MTSPSQSPMPVSIGGARVHRLLGRGGMAEAYLAERVRANFRKWVCIKRVLPQYRHDERFISLFNREAQTWARLDHPKIAKVFDFGEEDGLPFMVMEYVRGADLSRVLKAHRVLPFDVIFAVLVDAAEALHYAHAGGPDRPRLLHRDISPSNFLVSLHGTVMLTDFGISKAVERDYTQTEQLKGKIHYFAPETLTRRVQDPRSDLFAVGVTLFEMITGQKPYVGESEYRVLQRIADDERRQVRDLRPDTPEGLVRAVDRLLANRPDDRYASARELLHELPGPSAASRATLGDLARAVFEAEGRVQSLPPTPEPADTDPSGPTDREAIRASQVPFAPTLEAPAAGVVIGDEPYDPRRAQDEPTTPDASESTPTPLPASTPPPFATESTVEPTATLDSASIPSSVAYLPPAVRVGHTAPLPERALPSAPPARSRRKLPLWVGLLVGAFVVAGGITGTVLALIHNASITPSASDPQPPSPSPTPTPTPTPPAPAPAPRELRPEVSEQRVEEDEEQPHTPPVDTATEDEQENTAEAAQPAPGRRRGRLSVIVIPHGYVFLDGRRLGRAPLRGIPVAPGWHRVGAGEDRPEVGERVRILPGRSRVVRLRRPR